MKPLEKSKQRLTFEAVVTWIARITFEAAAKCLVVHCLARGQFAAHFSVAHWNALVRLLFAVAVVGAIVVDSALTNYHCNHKKQGTGI